MPIRVVSTVPTPSAIATVDPWVPLSLVWEIDPSVVPLYLFVRDPVQGYVELKVHPESGALVGLVLIDLPREVAGQQCLESVERVSGSTTPALDLELWPWKETPDYREPARRDVDAEVALSLTSTDRTVAIWFGQDAVSRVLQAGDVQAGVSMDDELIVIMVSGLDWSSIYRD